MFLKRRVRKKDGKEHVHYALCESLRVHSGRVVQRQVLHLGELNTTQTASWQRTLEIVNEEDGARLQRRLFTDRDGAAPADAQDVVEVRLSSLRVRAPRRFGDCWAGCRLISPCVSAVAPSPPRAVSGESSGKAPPGLARRGAGRFIRRLMSNPLWGRFQQFYSFDDDLGVSLDVSRMRFSDEWLAGMEPAAQKAFAAMDALEKGAMANPDEKRMVGHYWLRTPEIAPNDELREEIVTCYANIKEFAMRTHQSEKFMDVLVVGIGGSALGPQFVADALGTQEDRMRLHFFDNTDPDGIDRTLASLAHRLDHTLVITISKSGGTPETRNGMLEAEAAYQRAGIDFASHAVAVTGAGSPLDKYAVEKKWLARFPMWDWVGGRTSVMSAVGLVPLALQGLEIGGILEGASLMDEWTRSTETRKNPAMMLALSWHFAGGGKGAKDMVVLPYKDRLALFSKYLQQLVMESLGKRLDLDGKEVHQGIAVYGNKGSTDQHAYVQQLRDGVNNFFATFIEVRKARSAAGIEVEPGVTAGDYLQGFLRGTRQALYESGRDSVTLSIPEVSPKTVGAIIALYDRAVGFYASLVNINAYHQPGVEAGKKAAATLLALQRKVRAALGAEAKTAEQIAQAIGEEAEAVFHTLTHLAANDANVRGTAGSPAQQAFSVIPAA